LYVYKQDQHGNVVALLDGAGNIVERYTYDAFGAPTVVSWNPSTNSRDSSHPNSSAYGNRFMFQGREYLSEFQIYDFRHRMYHPDLGRFLQMDPIGFDAGDMNLFRYCGDDPLDRSDPTGLDAEENSNSDPGHRYSYYLQQQLKPDALNGWGIAHMTGRTSAAPYQCAAAAAILAGTWRSDGLHRAPEATSWLRGADVTKSTPRIGALVARGWDKDGHYQNKSNFDKSYTGNHAGIFAGFVNKDHKQMRLIDQWVVSQNPKTHEAVYMPIGMHVEPTQGYSRVDSSTPYQDRAIQVVLRPPDPSDSLPQSKK